MTDCVFCEIIRVGKYDEMFMDRVRESVVSFVPLNPVTPGHRLFVPATHVRDAVENPSVTADTYFVAASWARKERRSFNLITSVGRDATQSVFHLHVHYVPRTDGDGLHLPWTGQVIA